MSGDLIIDFGAYPVLPYWSKVRGPLFEIIDTIINRSERELGRELEARAKGLRTWLLTHMRVAKQTHEQVERLATLVKEKSVRLEAAVTIPPLVRVIMDSVFSVMFVFENVGERLPWFWKSTWREIVEDHIELAGEYGNDPVWQPWLGRLATERDAWRDQLAAQGTPLTAAELADHEKVKYWPNPGKMTGLCRAPGRKATLEYLKVRFYGDLSGASHLSGTGILAQGSVFLDTGDDSNKKYFSDQVLKGVTSLFALLSAVVIDVLPEPALARRVQGLWQTPNLWPMAVETYDRCFKADVEQLAAR